MIWFCLFIAHATVEIEPAPVVGQQSTVTVLNDISRPMASRAVRTTVRPGLRGEREGSAGLTDAMGRVYWTPQKPGKHLIRVDDDELEVYVRPEHLPWQAVGWLAGTAILGLGFVVIGVRRRESE